MPGQKLSNVINPLTSQTTGVQEEEADMPVPEDQDSDGENMIDLD